MTIIIPSFFFAFCDAYFKALVNSISAALRTSSVLNTSDAIAPNGKKNMDRAGRGSIPNKKLRLTATFQRA